MGWGIPARRIRSSTSLPGVPRSALTAWSLLQPSVDLRIDRDDLVAGLDAGTFRRGLRERRYDGDPAVAHIDLDAQTAVVARGGLGERLVVIVLQQDRIGILELLKQAGRRLLVEVALAESNRRSRR